MLQAVLFDLDGTLLRVDTAQFTSEYIKDLTSTVAPAVDPGSFTRALMSSISAMMAKREPGLTNSEVFWSDFKSRMGNSIEVLEPIFEDFYATKFKQLSRVASPGEYSRRAVQAALDRGLRIAMATQSVFPLSAVRDRMDWAGVADLPWDFVANYEEMHFCKPSPDYYLEIAERMGLQPGECIEECMAGIT